MNYPNNSNNIEIEKEKKAMLIFGLATFYFSFLLIFALLSIREEFLDTDVVLYFLIFFIPVYIFTALTFLIWASIRLWKEDKYYLIACFILVFIDLNLTPLFALIKIFTLPPDKNPITTLIEIFYTIAFLSITMIAYFIFSDKNLRIQKINLKDINQTK